MSPRSTSPRRRSDPPHGSVRPPGAATLWFALLGGFGAWVFHLGLSYAAVPFLCGTGGAAGLLHLITLGAALAAGAAAAVGWKAFRRVAGIEDEAELAAPEGVRGNRASARGADPPRAPGGGPPPAASPPSGTSPPPEASPAVGPSPAPDPIDPRIRTERFLALSGFLGSAFFLGLILVEGLPALIQGEPCRFVPLRDQPIIFLDGGAEVMAARLAPAISPAFPAGAPAGAVGSGWAADPWILVPAYLLVLAYLTGVARLWRRVGRGRGVPEWRAAAYLGGVLTLLLALVSPIHTIGGALFSVHMVQHLLLMVVAAPLLVLGRPVLALLWALPSAARRKVGGSWRRLSFLRAGWRAVSQPVAVIAAHVAVLWLWHVPALYEAALASRWVHHLEHASFFVTALLFWWTLAYAGARGRWPGYGAGILYVFAVALQSGALGALILFAPEPWYVAHAAGTLAWGIEPLADQQLAGVLMWVPPGLVYALAAALLLVAWMRKSEETVARRERAGWILAPSPAGSQISRGDAPRGVPEGESA